MFAMSSYDEVRYVLGQQGHICDSVYRLADKLMAADCDAESLMDAVTSRDPEGELRMLERMYFFK